MARSPSGESVMERIVRILDAFELHRPLLSVSDIARRAELPVTTAHRLVGEMLSLGLLERADRRRVRVGLRMWELGARSSRLMRMRDVALPFMDELHASVRHHTQLGVLDGSEVVHVERFSSPGSVTAAGYVGGRLPAHACAAGLVLLAYTPAERRETILSGDLARYTQDTIVDRNTLLRTIDDVRVRGYSIAKEMVVKGTSGAAAPVFDATGRAVAALTIVVPAEDDRVMGYVPVLLSAARGISRALRGTESPLDYSIPIGEARFFAAHRNNMRNRA